MSSCFRYLSGSSRATESHKWQVWKLECTNKIFIAHHAAGCVVFCFNYSDALLRGERKKGKSFPRTHASVHVMCHLLSEWVFARKFFLPSFLSLRCSGCLGCLNLSCSSVCERGKFSSNYRFIASFPSQHFDCLQISTFPVTFIHNILDVKDASRSSANLLFRAPRFARISHDGCKAPAVWSHEFRDKNFRQRRK